MSDQDLDDRLAAAAAVRDDELPPLPGSFLATLTGAEPASVLAARQLVADAHDRRRTFRRRRPGRTALVRSGVAVLGITAAWATAVVVAPADPAEAPSERTAAPAEESAPPSGPIEVDGMTLVATERVTFPFSLDPEPEGLTPSFGRSGGPTPVGTFPVMWGADYRADDGSGFLLSVDPEDPRIEWEFEHLTPQSSYSHAGITARGSATVDGVAADFVSGTWNQPRCTTAPSTPLQTEQPGEVCTSTFTDLVWERGDGRWMWLHGDDEYADIAALVGVAESIVDRPQPVDLQVGLAPAGWTVAGYEDTAIGLVDADDPDERIAVSLQERWRGWTPDTAFEGYTTVGSPRRVTVNDRPAQLGVVDMGDLDEWYLAGETDGGAPFLLQTPARFTERQVLEIAEQVTYTP